jgi:type IV pilus assembly protein PilP
MLRFRWVPAAFVPLAALLTSCAETSPRPPPTAQEVTAHVASPSAPEPGPPEQVARPLFEVPDEALEESARSRDPFRPAARPKAGTEGDRLRKSRRYAVEELKLVGLVTRIGTPRAMLVDPRGKGWVVTQGELVGKPEVIHTGGNAEVTANWRVDRIREDDVVLVREEASRSEATARRVLSLRPAPTIDAIDD